MPHWGTKYTEKLSGDQYFSTKYFYIQIWLEFPNSSSDAQYDGIKWSRISNGA